MAHPLRYALLACMFFWVGRPDVCAQITAATTTWSSSAYTNLQTGQSGTFETVFTVYNTDRIEMINGRYTAVFTAQSYTGTWTDTAQPGQIVFDVLHQDSAGKLTVGRDATGLFVILNFQQSSPDGIFCRFNISQHGTQN